MRVDAASQKTVLRRRLIESFGSFNPALAPEAADRMVERLLELPEVARASRILTCLSFHREIDTWRLVDRLLAAGGEVYVPRADPRDRQLHLHRYPCDLQELSFGQQSACAMRRS